MQARKRTEKLPEWGNFCNFAVDPFVLDTDRSESMARRRYISLLLLAVYLLAAGGGAYVSLSCRCIAEKHACAQVHGCHGCADHGACGRCVFDDGAAQTLEAPCCGDRHSTEIDLYTGAHSDYEKAVRCVVTLLPPSLAAECPCPAHVPALRRRSVERPAPVPAAPLLEFAGLRAPPASV